MVIHCTVAVSTSNSLMSCGKSTVITVSVRMPMNANDPTATMAPMSLLGIRSSGVGLATVVLCVISLPDDSLLFTMFSASIFPCLRTFSYGQVRWPLPESHLAV